MEEEYVPGMAFSGTYQGNVYPKSLFWVHVRDTCTRKAVFGYISGKAAYGHGVRRSTVGRFTERNNESRVDAIIKGAELLRRWNGCAEGLKEHIV